MCLYVYYNGSLTLNIIWASVKYSWFLSICMWTQCSYSCLDLWVYSTVCNTKGVWHSYIKKHMPPHEHYNTNLVDLTECWNPSNGRGCENRREQFLHWVDVGIDRLHDSVLIDEKKKNCRSQLRDASLLFRWITMILKNLMRCVWSRMHRSS